MKVDQSLQNFRECDSLGLHSGCSSIELPNRYIHLGLGWIGDKGGGLERYQDGICSQHARLGCNVTAWVQSRSAITCESPLSSDAADGLLYKAIAYASPTEKRSIKLRKLLSLARKSFGNGDFAFVSHHASVSGSLLSMVSNVPHIVHFHGPWADEAAVEGAPWWKTAGQRYQERRVYRSADRIITLSEAFKEVVTNRYGVSPDIVRVIPGAIDSKAADPMISRQEARLRMGWPLDRPVVLSIRRLVRRVGADILIDAVAQLLREHRQFSDLLVMLGGTGPMRESLQQRISEAGLQENVKLLGFVPDELLSTAYRGADFSIVPTQSLEGFGLVTLESMAAGTPAVVTPVGSLPEVMNDLQPSLVMPGKSAGDIKEGLRAYLSKTVALPDDVACRAYVKRKFDWSVIAPRVRDVYNEAAAIGVKKSNYVGT